MLPVNRAHCMDSDNVCMLKAGGCARFPAKTFDAFGAGKLAKQKHFDGHGAVQTDLPRAINHPHSAMRDFFQKLIITETAKVQFLGWGETIRRWRRIFTNFRRMARFGVEKGSTEHAAWANTFRSELIQRPAALVASLLHLRAFTVGRTILKRKCRNGYNKLKKWLSLELRAVHAFYQGSLRLLIASIR